MTASTNAKWPPARWLPLLVGSLLSFLAAGGRWDVALAAWVAPVLLLRFARSGRWAVSLGLVLIVSIANVVWWAVQSAVPLTALTLGFAAMLGIAYALPYALDRVAGRLGVVGRLLVFPMAVAASEFVVGAVSPMGVSYGLRATTQAETLPLIQVVAVTGPYAIGFLVGWFATTANHVWAHPSWSGARRPAALFAAVLLAVIVGGQARLALALNDIGGAHIRIAGITPSMDAQDSARRLFAEGNGARGPENSTILERQRAAYGVVEAELFQSTRQAAAAGADIVVWSETAATALAADRSALLTRAAALAREQGVYLNVAVGEPFARNQTVLIDPAGRRLWVYDKNHPVPGMEPVPPRANPVPVVATPFGRLSNVICFDADFPALARVDADIMLVPGWDWPEMGRVHTLRMARLRAVENGYALFRQDYDGQSAAFDRFGQVLASQDTTGRARHVMIAEVPSRGVRTIYNRTGDVFAWACLAGLVLATGLSLARRREGRASGRAASSSTD